MSYVYLKTGKYDGTDLTVTTIPLKVTSVGVSVSKTIPSFPIPFSGAVTGESVTAALDLGMCAKSIDLQGTITETSLSKTRTGADGESEVSTSLTFTAHEIAQMIASSVDSTGLQDNQSISELVILYPSNIGNNYQTRATPKTLIPFNFASRGEAGFGDNEGVLFKNSVFPDVNSDTGLTGFIRSFNFNMTSETVNLDFSMQFEVAVIGP